MGYKSLRIGVSGLQAQQKKIQVISDNLANVNTAGFKKSYVSFQERSAQVLESGSRGKGDIGGTNPTVIGNGVEVSTISSVFSQGTREETGRTLDFMVEGDDFLVARNGTTKELMLTRNGSFQLDGDMNLVDSMGNKVMGFNTDISKGTIEDISREIQLSQAIIAARATTEVDFSKNLNASSFEETATGDTKLHQIFSGGEGFGKMEIASVGETGSMKEYGSGYYQNNAFYYTDTVSMTGTNTISLGNSPSNLWEGFKSGDQVRIRHGGTNELFTTTLTTTPLSNDTLTLDKPLPSTFTIGDTLSVTNLSKGLSRVGSSGDSLHNDVLKSQIAMVDEEGRLIASFYRVSGGAREYEHANATLDDGSEIKIGVGEFSSMSELKGLMEQALRDRDLTHADLTTTSANVSMDKREELQFEGDGLVSHFRLAIHAENEEMRNRFEGFLLSSAELTSSQALLNEEGVVQNNGANLALGERSANATKPWYATGVESFGLNSNNSGNLFGEFVGLNFKDLESSGGEGTLRLSLTNALGDKVVKEFYHVPRDPDVAGRQFSTFEELALLLQNTLRTKEFSTLSQEGIPITDSSATVQFNNGRLSLNTQRGIFQELKLEALGEGSPENPRSDKINFSSILGNLTQGINGKQALSDKIVTSNLSQDVQIFDNKGNVHYATTHFIKDQTDGLKQIEWKFKIALNPNINHEMEGGNIDTSAYVPTYNSINSMESQGTLAFDINTGKLIENSLDGENYSTSGKLRFSPQTNQAVAGESMISLDFSKLSSFSGSSNILGSNVDGFPMGELLRIQTEKNTGNINGVYSNGETRLLAKVGVMSIDNPEGLQKVGSSYFIQTENANQNGIKGNSEIKFASTEGYSAVHGGSLESSNVDIAEELTKMIVAQRGFGAMGKIITTADNVLEQTLALKR